MIKHYCSRTESYACPAAILQNTAHKTETIASLKLDLWRLLFRTFTDRLECIKRNCIKHNIIETLNNVKKVFNGTNVALSIALRERVFEHVTNGTRCCQWCQLRWPLIFRHQHSLRPKYLPRHQHHHHLHDIIQRLLWCSLFHKLQTGSRMAVTSNGTFSKMSYFELS